MDNVTRVLGYLLDNKVLTLTYSSSFSQFRKRIEKMFYQELNKIYKNNEDLFISFNTLALLYYLKEVAPENKSISVNDIVLMLGLIKVVGINDKIQKCI